MRICLQMRINNRFKLLMLNNKQLLLGLRVLTEQRMEDFRISYPKWLDHHKYFKRSNRSWRWRTMLTLCKVSMLRICSIRTSCLYSVNKIINNIWVKSKRRLLRILFNKIISHTIQNPLTTLKMVNSLARTLKCKPITLQLQVVHSIIGREETSWDLLKLEEN